MNFTITDLLSEEKQIRDFLETTFALAPDITGTLLNLQIDSNQVSGTFLSHYNL